MSRGRIVSLFSGLLFFLIVGAFAPTLFAQGTGQIEGVIRDEQGGVLPGVGVTLRNEDSGVTRTVVSEADGRYVLAGLAPGRYLIRAELSGFATQEVRDVVMTIGL